MERLKVLIIDDEAYIREIFERILEQNDYLVQTAENGLEALEILNRDHVDVSIIDIGLPDMDGNHLLKSIKHDYPSMICIQITGQATLGTAIESIHHGADGYFVKPIMLSDMLSRLDSILEKRRMREEIEQLRELPRQIIDSVNEQIAIINVEDYKLVAVNKGFLEAVGLSEEEVVGRTCYEVTHHQSFPCSGPDEICTIPETVRTRSYQRAEHLHYDKGKNPRYVEISTLPLKYGDDGAVTQVVHVARDITERKILEITLAEEQQRLLEAHNELSETYEDLKRSQSQIIQQEKMASIGQLAAGVAHEINNPMGFISSNLTSLGGYVEKVVEFVGTMENVIADLNSGQKVASVEEQRKKLKINYILEDLPDLINESLEGADRVKNIVQNMKVFSRADKNEKCETDVNNCLETTLNMIWNELKYKAEVTKDYGELPIIQGYPQQLNQVFMNLIMNAVQAIEEHGEISIKSSYDRENIYVAISDTGCGIPEENLDKIFEPFFTTKEEGKGTGLGMSITLEIVQKHNGDIKLETEVGKGTAFTVILPCKEGP